MLKCGGHYGLSSNFVDHLGPLLPLCPDIFTLLLLVQLFNAIFPYWVKRRLHARLNNFPIMADSRSVISARDSQARPNFQTLSMGSVTRQHAPRWPPRLVAQGGIISMELRVGIQQGGNTGGGGPRPAEVR